MADGTFPVVITPAAAKRIHALRAKDARLDVFLRLGIKGGGCSGFEYLIVLDDKKREGDFIALLDDLEVRVDPKSAKFLDGATLDYSGNLIGGGLQFSNPNADRSCGCGSSFTPKKTG